jgi:hypothetical protein
MLNEAYLGSPEDQRYIQAFLALVRSIDPIEISTTPTFFRLSEREKLGDLIEYDVFLDIVNQANNLIMNDYSDSYHSITYDRYLIGFAMDDGMGGFHDERSFGYHFYYSAGFVLLMNPGIVKNKMVRTVELARNYLHDCLHHSTFRSFRRRDNFPAKDGKSAKISLPEFYREQYGINFRNQDGVSYSSVNLTKKSPQAINLNLLMDGAVVLTAASVLEGIGSRNLIDVSKIYGMDKVVWNEVFLRDFEYDTHPRAGVFRRDVQSPTQCFIDYWGGNAFLRLIIQSMFSGDLRELKQFFSEKSHEADAWEKVFKRPGFEV